MLVKLRIFSSLLVVLFSGVLACPIRSFAQSSYRLWSDRPAFTILLENQHENGRTSSVYDHVWEGNPVPKPVVTEKPSEQKKWTAAEGVDYLDNEVYRITGGKYNNARRIWEQEGYPIGNGRLGAMVFNGSGRDRYALNEVSYWSGGQNAGTINNKGDKKFDGRIGPDEGNDGFGGYQPIGDLIADFGSPVKKGSFTRSVDINHGEIVSTGIRKGVKTSSTAFISFPDQTIVIRYKADKPGGLKINFTYVTQRPQDVTSAEGNTMTITGELKNGIKFKGKALFLNTGGVLHAKNGIIELRNADACTIILDIETNYLMDFSKNWRGEDPSNRVDDRLNLAKEKPFEILQANHRKDYQGLFDRERFSLGKTSPDLMKQPTYKRLAAYRIHPADPNLEETILNYGRYLMIQTSRPGSLPAGLQGIWNGLIDAPWGNDYHSNINFQMVYWLPEVGNLSECHLPMLDYLKATRRPNQIATREYMQAVDSAVAAHTRGWIVYTSHNPFGGQGWQVNLPGAAWYGLHMWEHYAFTQDKDYLRNMAYPMMKELCAFWEDHLKELGQGGKGFKTDYKEIDVSKFPELSDVKAGTLVAPNGWSPEHGPREDGVAHDQQIIFELFNNTVAAANILGIDRPWADSLSQKRDRLAKPKIGKKGDLMEWMIERDPVTDHRHTSNLFAVYPGSMISKNKTPELAEAARKSLLWRANSGNSWRSWAWTWRCMIWSRLQEGEKAHDMLSGLITHNMLDNLFTTHHIPLQIDGNYGIAAAMIEMLIQSVDGKIELLPALPDAWKDGYAKGLKARGNITVDLSWKDGKVTEWSLRSPEPKPLTIKINGKTETVTPKKMLD